MPLKKTTIVALVCLSLILSSASSHSGGEEPPAEPREPEFVLYTGLEVEPVYSQSHVDRPHSRYAFAPALQGDVVRHDFLIRNDSEDVLAIHRVTSCCGCIVESFSREIQPGLTGRISTVFLTDSRGGQVIEAIIRAETSDAARPEIAIDVSLPVKEFASLSPYRTWLQGSPGQDIVETCIVIPSPDYPFAITGIRPRKGVWFSHSYREIERQGRRAYEITLRNTRRKPGSYQDVLFVQTDHTARPELKIRVEGRIAELP